MKVVALSGGIGGARLVDGLARVLAPEDLTVVANTGDDFEHLGLYLSPDIDTLLYTLGGVSDPDRGWGRAGETWTFMSAMGELGGEDWFLLGDRDLATHVLRTRSLRDGATLSEATAELAARMGVGTRVVPMSDEPVRTVVDTDCGALPFQEYFVRRRCEPRVSGLRFKGSETARPAAAVTSSLTDPELGAVIVCPSNPYLSIDPILSIVAISDMLRHTAAPVVAVSPIVAGKSLKGPTARIMRQLGVDVSVVTIARAYAGFLDGLLIDGADRSSLGAVEALGIAAGTADIVMSATARKVEVAQAALRLAESLDTRPRMDQV